VASRRDKRVVLMVHYSGNRTHDPSHLNPKTYPTMLFGHPNPEKKCEAVPHQKRRQATWLFFFLDQKLMTIVCFVDAVPIPLRTDETGCAERSSLDGIIKSATTGTKIPTSQYHSISIIQLGLQDDPFSTNNRVDLLILGDNDCI